jgi:hypothetical protein
MHASRENFNRTWRRLLRATYDSLGLMNAADQTRLSWAKPVRAVDEIPDFYLDYLRANLPDPRACLPGVLTPTFRGFLRRENEKLVFTHNSRLYILEQTQSGLLPTIFPFNEINYIEVGAILLKAWLRIDGLVHGQLNSQILRFNTVTQFLFDPLVALIRHALTDCPDQADLRTEQARFEPLRQRHFKFVSYARNSLLPGERVISYVMQPEMRAPRLSLLGKSVTMRIIDTAHLCILTDGELIVIRDDPASLQSCNETRYGGVWDYIPLCRVRAAALEEREDGLALTLCQPGDERFNVLFASEHRLEAERMCARLQLGINTG